MRKQICPYCGNEVKPDNKYSPFCDPCCADRQEKKRRISEYYAIGGWNHLGNNNYQATKHLGS